MKIDLTTPFFRIVCRTFPIAFNPNGRWIPYTAREVYWRRLARFTCKIMGFGFAAIPPASSPITSPIIPPINLPVPYSGPEMIPYLPLPGELFGGPSPSDFFSPELTGLIPAPTPFVQTVEPSTILLLIAFIVLLIVVRSTSKVTMKVRENE